MRAGGAFDVFLKVVLPARMRRWTEAEQALALLVVVGCRVEVRHGSVRVDPANAVPPEVSQWLGAPENRHTLEAMLDEFER